MPPAEPQFREAPPGAARPIRDLGLDVAGSDLEPVVAEFRDELRQKGLTRIVPDIYLSTEWGVADGTIAIAIPFYLARADLRAEHARRVGHVEGLGRDDVLRYLRHEMGHVVNYAYRLHAADDWTRLFGPIDQPYREDYHPRPFSRRFVRHLPGWYAQKHPDEDWAETFAVWMTPGLDWRAEYAAWPAALAKLAYCDRTMAAVAALDPPVTSAERDLDVAEIAQTLDDYYGTWLLADAPPPDLDGDLRSIFEDLGALTSAPPEAPRKLASALIDAIEPDLIASVFRWTGHFPERTRPLLRHIAARADALSLLYPADHDAHAAVALTAFVTTLALNHVHHGSYLIDHDDPSPGGLLTSS